MNRYIDIKERIRTIVSLSTEIFLNRIAIGDILFENEASMQLQLGVIMQNVGKLFEFSNDEHFCISLEHVENIMPTQKSPAGQARCDIWVEFINRDEKTTCAIELKYFPQTKNETVTENRFSILKDLENIEHYESANMGYQIVYTDNKNYADPKTRSYINIGEGQVLKGKIESNGKEVYLQNEYPMHWKIMEIQGKSHCLLKIEL